MSGRPWTSEEEARLRDLYPVTRTSDLPAVLGRSALAIKVRASALHLRKDPEVSMRLREELELAYFAMEGAGA